MTEKYLIALDLDGTVLTDDKQITQTTKQTISQLRDAGHIVVIATGRTNGTSVHYYHELALNTPMINSNGALIHHPKDSNWETVHTPLSLEVTNEIIELGLAHNMKNLLATIKDHTFLHAFDRDIIEFFNREKKEPSITVGDIQTHLHAGPTGILLYPDIGLLDSLTNELNQLQTGIVDHRNWGMPDYTIEIMNNEMNKWVGLKKLAAHFNISHNHIMAFGDGGNDLEMIENASIGVAMENAVPELKSVAKHRTTTNEANGVADFLAEYFQLRDLPVS